MTAQKMIPDKYDNEGLSQAKAEWVKDILSNDDIADDLELVELFTTNGLYQEEAEKWVNRRSFYMNNIVQTYHE